MPWIILFLAGLFEIVWATSMKQSDGFSRPLPTIVMLAALVLSFAMLAWSMKSLPLGTAYMIWSGIGAVGAFVVGIIWLGEALSAARIAAAMLIVGGLVLMKLSSPA
ncbi:MAG: QacE family quaternary ammonium compound efflux SMR transporter [Paracoccus sp.]|nr:QacE family quaternary ammonium compound efflux SMR transporter [Paracoccus sp. (in: a-proteobacteria)]MAN58193.1 QacE family quaternary ammonium compound efflux SMR transporter [Paracoccus sp. (in: a-proteobacteria)]|tara:strand:- start:61747 stop:62067 length:321 start_codon:yes stop_codon:yes gene_type:complete